MMSLQLGLVFTLNGAVAFVLLIWWASYHNSDETRSFFQVFPRGSTFLASIIGIVSAQLCFLCAFREIEKVQWYFTVAEIYTGFAVVFTIVLLFLRIMAELKLRRWDIQLDRFGRHLLSYGLLPTLIVGGLLCLLPVLPVLPLAIHSAVLAFITVPLVGGWWIYTWEEFEYYNTSVK